MGHRASRFLRRGVSRRHFLRGAAAASALVGAQPFLLAGEDDVSPAPASTTAVPFRHGVASGDPLADRVVLWTRVSLSNPPQEVPVDYIVAADPQLRQVLQAGRTLAERRHDYTVKVDVAGLSPATTYYYRFAAAGAHSPIGRTRTLPVGSVERLRIAVVSCAALAHGYFNAYRRVARRPDLDLVVHLGDYIYEHADGEYGSLRGYQPPWEIVTLRDYRRRHNQYKTDRDLQELHRQHPVIAVWDDHEIADNAWKAGAENHQPATEGSYAERVAAAVRAYHEWMPIRHASTDRRRITRAFRLGDLAELFMLEERLTARDEPADPNLGDTPLFTQTGEFADPARRVISDQQQTWLVERLRQSRAPWKLIGQGVMLAPARVGKTPDGRDVFFNPDQWDGYRPARDRLLRAIGGSADVPPVRNVVVLTGDIHSSWAADLPLNPYGAGYDPGTGAGSRAVEFVGTSVTSPGFDDPDGRAAEGFRLLNPHLKYVELRRRGYLLLDITSQRVSGEWWYVDTVATRSSIETFGAAWQCPFGRNALQPGTQSAPRSGAPPLAP